MSMNELTPPLPPNLVLKMCKRISKVLDVVHGLGWIIADIKPSNLFMASNGDIDLGDFGGAVPIGEHIREYTSDYLPEELLGDATVTVDFVCLTATALSMLEVNYRPNSTSVEGLKKTVELVSNIEVKELLLRFLSK